MWRLPVRPGAVVRRLAGRIEWRKASRSAARTGAARRSVSMRSMMARQPDELARRVQVQQLVHQQRRAVDRREPGLDHRPDLIGADVGAEPDEVLGIERRLAQLGLAALVATDRAAIDAGHGVRGWIAGRPDELLRDEHPAAGRAAGRVQVAEGDLQAGFAARRGGHALERGVEVADIGRAQDDLGQHPGERVRLQADGPALLVESRAGDPATTAEQVRDDVTGPRVRLDPGRDEGLGRRGSNRS